VSTHFDIFGLEPQVDLDVKALEQKHRDLSLEYHPDRVKDPDARTRRLAVERQTALNDAFKVLKDPVRRAFYVLKLKGVDLEKDETAAKASMPMSFLEEVMERREALEAVKAKQDLAGARAMADEVSALKDQALKAAQDALRAGALEEATHQLGRVRYLGRFLEEVEAFEEESLS
jgi:molecular chaperone HscB